MRQIDSNLLTVDEISKLYNLSKPTINYYTNMGLLSIADKHGNKRLYNKAEVHKRLEKIREMRRSGYSLRLIRRQFASSP